MISWVIFCVFGAAFAYSCFNHNISHFSKYLVKAVKFILPVFDLFAIYVIVKHYTRYLEITFKADGANTNYCKYALQATKRGKKYPQIKISENKS